MVEQPLTGQEELGPPSPPGIPDAPLWEAQERVIRKSQGGGQGLLGLLVFWGARRVVVVDGVDSMWVPRVVMGDGSSLCNLGLSCRRGEATGAADWRLRGPRIMCGGSCKYPMVCVENRVARRAGVTLLSGGGRT